MLKASFYIFLATIFSFTFVGATRADTSEGQATARQGIVRCGGNNFTRLTDGAELHFVSWTLRNVDPTEPIIIDRMRFFDATGLVIRDSANSTWPLSSGLPASDNGLLGPGDNTLGPNQTASFSSDGLLPFLAQTDRPGQLEITWSSAKPALTLWVATSRIVRERLTVSPFTRGVERSRSVRECRSIFLK